MDLTGGRRRAVPSTPGPRQVGLAAGVVALALALAGPVLAPAGPAAATTAGPPSAGPSPPAGPDPAVEAEPSAEEAAAQARALALRAQVRQRADALAAAQLTLADASAQAAAALETYSQAQRAGQASQLAADQAQSRSTQAGQVLEDQRAALGRWARAAYAQGGLLASNPGLVTILDGGSTDAVSRTIEILTVIGDSRGRAVRDYAVASRVAATAAADAEAAQVQAAAAQAQAQAASVARDAAVTAQRDTVTRLTAELTDAAGAAALALRQATLLANARLFAGLATGSSGRAAAGGNAVTGAVGDCPGGDTRLYPNGEIPLTALCPVWGSAGDYLRADAAYAFDRLSVAYAQQFGRPVCVTDSYRPYAEQVAVYARSPDLAAVPGTSNHGWGTAADLCGGIESFTAPAHAWMLLHAPGFGWFHPAWAEPTGSKPEAWHWEFGG